MNVKILKYREHDNLYLDRFDSQAFQKENYTFLFNKRRGENLPCYTINFEPKTDSYFLTTSYLIGLDWIEKKSSAIYVAPKLNRFGRELDFTKMLFDSLKNPEVSKEVDELFLIKWDDPLIEIEQKDDLLTPFLIVEFLSLLKVIVRKGLKRTYYKVDKNLNGRIKGKVLVSKTIKENITHNNYLDTFCRYQEFGFNNKENRLLKKTLLFIKRYLPTYSQLRNHIDLRNTFNYIDPAFDQVSDSIDLNEIKHSKINVFYKEYGPAIRLAKLILKRFGYNISNTVKSKINTPPFWIDMSKLFELYVLGLLKERFNKAVKYQFSTYGNEIDYLLNSENLKMIIDAKYKLKYIDSRDHQDIRQVSGYARLNKIYDEFNIDSNELIDCLIIHPDQDQGVTNFKDIDFKKTPILDYKKVYKIGVELPVI